MVKNNNSKVDIREVYKLIEALEERINKRLDDITDNHMQHLSDRIAFVEKEVWFASGVVATIVLVLKFFIK